MKKIFGILLAVVVVGCAFSGNDEKSEATKTITCDQSATYGDVDICLPEIDGMVESYGNTRVKARADAFNPDINVILGYYLNDSTYQQVERSEEVVIDDYFQIYASKNLQGVKVTTAELDKMGETISDNYIKENWNDLNEKINKEFDFLSVAKPILLDAYTPSADARTYVLIIKYEEEGGEDFHILLTTMNVLKLQDRMIFMAYYQSFENEESVNKIKERNNEIVEALVAANT